MDPLKKRFAAAVRCAALGAALAVAPRLFGAPCDVVDDFIGGGSLYDCLPQCWAFYPCCPGVFSPTENGLEVSATTELSANASMDYFIGGDITVRLRGNFNGTEMTPNIYGSYPHMVATAHMSSDISGYSGGVSVIGEFSIRRWISGQTQARVPSHLGYFPGDDDMELELKVTGSHIELRVWRWRLEERPKEAQVSYDDPFPTTNGYAGFYAWNKGRPILIRSIAITVPPPCEPSFRRGDANGDGALDISDPVATLFHLFLGTESPGCLDAADADDSGEVEIADLVFMLEFLFLEGRAPEPPYPACGIDQTQDELDCLEYSSCSTP